MRSLCLTVLLLAACRPALAQGPATDPAAEVRAHAAAGRYDRAGAVVAEWMRTSPDDLDARAWHARLLSWTNRWPEAEAEYRDLLARSPNDVDLLAGLADVLAWQGRADEALPLLERGCSLDRERGDTALRRARLLQQQGRTVEAREAFEDALRRDPASADARIGLEQLRPRGRHRVVVASAFENPDYAGNGGTFEASVDTAWTARWATRGSLTQFYRYGQPATRVAGAVTRRLVGRQWLSVGAAAAADNAIVPRGELQAEFGRTFRFDSSSVVRGVEASFQPQGQWYRDASVLRLTPGALVYLPREWHCLVRVSANRVATDRAPGDWKASGWTRVSFPLTARFGGFALAGVGTEDSVYLDRMLAASSRTLGGGLRIQFPDGRDSVVTVQRQSWSGDRAQTSVGVSYGVRH